jgi:hypothetical protein
MSTDTLGANVPVSPEECWTEWYLDETKLSPEFATLHREFVAALNEEDAAIAEWDNTPAAHACLCVASNRVWEVWRRVQASEAVYVKDLRVRDLPLFWALKRHPDRLLAESQNRSDAYDARKAGRLQ